MRDVHSAGEGIPDDRRLKGGYFQVHLLVFLEEIRELLLGLFRALVQGAVPVISACQNSANHRTHMRQEPEPNEDVLEGEVLRDLKLLAKVLHEDHLVCGKHAFHGIGHEPWEQGRGDASVDELEGSDFSRLVERACAVAAPAMLSYSDHGFDGGGKEIGGDDSGLADLKAPATIVRGVLDCVEHILGEVQLRVKRFQNLLHDHGGRNLACVSERAASAPSNTREEEKPYPAFRSIA